MKDQSEKNDIGNTFLKIKYNKLVHSENFYQAIEIFRKYIILYFTLTHEITFKNFFYNNKFKDFTYNLHNSWLKYLKNFLNENFQIKPLNESTICLNLINALLFQTNTLAYVN